MLKVLLYSHFFYPDLGGVETVSLTLAEGFLSKGVECKVITTTISSDKNQFAFEVIRNPQTSQKIDLIKWADIVLFNGATMALQPWVLVYRKPFIWVHVGYQVSCIDGLGWVDGLRAPIRPVDSFEYHIKLKGLKWGILQGFKLAIRRAFAKYVVSKNIAISQWMFKTQPLPRQLHIYNPFPVSQFLDINISTEPEYDFMYLGRLVSEKGVSTLLSAFAHVINEEHKTCRLLIIGDGQWRGKMELLANDLNIAEFVTFAGKKSGKELLEFVSKGKIAVIPSEWYEPMGGVALELMAAGKNLIVSELGGLKESVGDCALLFPNGDFRALADCMTRLLEDKSLQAAQHLKSKERVKLFNPDVFISQYIDLLKSLKNNRKRSVLFKLPMTRSRFIRADKY